MIVRVRKSMCFFNDYVALVHHLFAAGGAIAGLDASRMFSRKAVRQWLNALEDTDPFHYPRQVIDGVVFETSCFTLSTALAEMSCSARENRRCIKPAFCFTLSWGAADAVTDDAAFLTVKSCLQATGMAGHSYVAVIRRDSTHIWCRVVVYCVPEEGGLAVNLWRNVDTLQYACREAEQLHGWKHEAGEIIRPQARHR